MGDAESELSSFFSGLRLEGVRGEALLIRINERLRLEVEGSGMSMTKIRKYIKDKGIALGTGQEFGSPAALRQALHQKGYKKLLVRRELAKKYLYVKNCLIVL